jgi:hypothetical protein
VDDILVPPPEGAIAIGLRPPDTLPVRRSNSLNGSNRMSIFSTSYLGDFCCRSVLDSNSRAHFLTTIDSGFVGTDLRRQPDGLVGEQLLTSMLLHDGLLHLGCCCCGSSATTSKTT